MISEEIAESMASKIGYTSPSCVLLPSPLSQTRLYPEDTEKIVSILSHPQREAQREVGKWLSCEVGKSQRQFRVVSNHVSANQRIWDKLAWNKTAFPHCLWYSAVIIQLNFWPTECKQEKYVQILSIIKGRWFCSFPGISLYASWNDNTEASSRFLDYERENKNYYLLNSLLLGMGRVADNWIKLDFNKYSICLLHKNAYRAATITTYPH